MFLKSLYQIFSFFVINVVYIIQSTVDRARVEHTPASPSVRVDAPLDPSTSVGHDIDAGLREMESLDAECARTLAAYGTLPAHEADDSLEID